MIIIHHFRHLMTSILLLLGCCLLMTSCHKNQDDMSTMALNPTKLQRLLIRCENPNDNQLITTSLCAKAKKAQQLLSPYWNILMANPELFGKQIMAKQNELAALRKQQQSIDKSKQPLLEKKIIKIQQQIAIMLMLTRMAGE